MYMKYFSVAEARAKFAEVVDLSTTSNEPVVITRNGEPTAVMISIEDYEVMTETLETISEPETLAALLDWQQNPSQQTFTVDEVRDALAKRLGGNA